MTAMRGQADILGGCSWIGKGFILHLTAFAYLSQSLIQRESKRGKIYLYLLRSYQFKGTVA
jgi:hypothetical protein